MTHAIDDAIEPLLALPRTGSGVGLARFLTLVEPLFDTPWLRSLEAIKITGSNGKGSVTAMTSALLSALGLSTGRYVSPHLFRFSERIGLNEEPVGDEALGAALRWFEGRKAAFDAAHPGEAVAAFEAFTAVALHAFHAHAPDVLVAEAGIGGRYDPTRVLPGGLAALTSVDLEHTDLLGATRELIAYDKADLCPDGGHLVLGALDDALFARIEGYARARRVTVERPLATSRIENVAFFSTHMELDLHTESLSLPGLRLRPLGRHQIQNAVVALTLVRRWLLRTGREDAVRALPEVARSVFASLSWPARFERVAEEPEVFVDVGHTPDAAARAAETARALLGDKPLVLLVGVSAQKNVAEVARTLGAAASEVVATRALFRGADASQVASALRSACPRQTVHERPLMQEAFAFALERARARGGALLVAGSLYLAVESRELCAGRDPAALRFFG